MPTDPKVGVLDVLEEYWDASQTPLADPPEFHTGRYDREGTLPAITVPNMQESPQGDGGTGLAGITGKSGKGVQILNGGVTIDIVAGTWEDCEGVGANGADRNPKAVRWQLYEHTAQIILNQARFVSGTKLAAPGSGTEVVDKSDDPDLKPVFRHEFRATFVRFRRPD